jgi:hypothetical protein
MAVLSVGTIQPVAVLMSREEASFPADRYGELFSPSESGAILRWNQTGALSEN